MLVSQFAHSFDRETFHGSKSTRQEALREAMDKLPQLDSSPDMIYIGKRVPIDLGSTGLAEMIVNTMRHKVRQDAEFDTSGKYLTQVNEHQLAELDEQIDQVVRAWLTKHNLAPTQSRVVAISEHPVPSPRMIPASR